MVFSQGKPELSCARRPRHGGRRYTSEDFGVLSVSGRGHGAWLNNSERSMQSLGLSELKTLQAQPLNLTRSLH